MKKQKNTTKEYPIHVGVDSISAQKHRGIKSTQGITLIALVITILFSYDEKLKCSSNKGFLLVTI